MDTKYGRVADATGLSQAEPKVSALTGFDPSRIYASDSRNLFCAHCGRAHWRHRYEKGIGFVCDSDGNPKGGDGTAPSRSDDSAAIAQSSPGDPQ